MGLFDNLIGDAQALLGGKPGAASALLSDAFNDMGGYQGILDKLQQSGLGAQVDSWLSANASNLPVSPAQIQAALGDQSLQAIAAKLGIPLDQVASVLAHHLPASVDQASPNGVLQQPTA